MTHGDFYCVEIVSTKRTELLKSGAVGAVECSKKMVQYGRKQFPRYTYSLSVGYVDVLGNPSAASAKADSISAEWRAKGFKTKIKYIAVD